jgi:hypothetical protein
MYRNRLDHKVLGLGVVESIRRFEYNHHIHITLARIYPTRTWQARKKMEPTWKTLSGVHGGLTALGRSGPADYCRKVNFHGQTDLLSDNQLEIHSHNG